LKCHDLGKPWLWLGNLPIGGTSFVGCRRERSEVRRLLGDGRFLRDCPGFS
jgi:hypothetical protein